MVEKVYILIKFVDGEGDQIQGVVTDQEVANKWTEDSILQLSGEASVLAPDITLLPQGYKYWDTGFIYQQFELNAFKPPRP